MNIKKIYGSMPEWIKEIVGQVGRYKIIYSSSFRKQYNLLENHNYIANSEMIDKYQIILLKETLKYAYQHIQYYQELFDEIHFNVDEFEDAYMNLSSVSVNVGNVIRKGIFDYTLAALQGIKKSWYNCLINK